MSNATISFQNYDLTYTGSSKTPPLNVLIGSTTLNKDIDYTVEYSNNILAGTNTATVTITGIGNYKDTASATFSIQKANQPAISITNKPNSTNFVFGNNDSFSIGTSGGAGTGAFTYNSSNPSVATIDSNGNIVVVGIGSATITAQKVGDNNYNNSALQSFEINVADNYAKIGNVYYSSLEDAINSANANETIILTKDCVINTAINIDKNITISGDNNTINFGAQGKLNINAGGALNIENTDIDGGAIWGATGSDNLNSNSGINRTNNSLIDIANGGILNLNNTVIHNTDVRLGNGVINVLGELNLTDSAFEQNLANKGGAIYAGANSTVNIENSNFERNQAVNGGAIYADTNSTVTVKDTTISNNYTSQKGEGIFVEHNSNVTLDNANISDIIYLNSKDSSGSEIGKVNVKATDTMVILEINEASANYYDSIIDSGAQAPEMPIAISDTLSSLELKDNVRIKNTGYTANPNLSTSNGQLEIMETDEITAAFYNTTTGKYEYFKTISKAVSVLSERGITDSEIFVVGTYRELTGEWDNDQTARATESVVIPEGMNITLNSGKRTVAADGVTVTFQPSEDAMTLKRSSLTDAMFEVSEGANLTIGNVIIDGGAQWVNGSVAETITSNSTAAGDVNYSLQTGEFANAPIIVNKGNLVLEENAILQNNENRFNKFGSENYGGGIANIDGASLLMKEGSQIKDCYAREGGGIQNINRNQESGNSVIINGSITGCVSHTKGAAVETIYGGENGSNTQINPSAVIENNLSLNNLGVITVEEGGKIVINGGSISSSKSTDYDIYVYNKYGSNDIVADKFGNIAYVEGVNAAQIAISGAPQFDNIYLGAPCEEITEGNPYIPYLDMVGYTGENIKVTIENTHTIDSVVAKGNTNELSKLQISTTLPPNGTITDRFFYQSGNELKTGGYNIEIIQTGIGIFKVTGEVYGLEEVTINGKVFAVVDNKISGTISVSDGDVTIDETNYANVNIDYIYPQDNQVTREHIDAIGAITIDENYVLYSPEGTLYVNNDGDNVILPTDILPNDIAIDENGQATFIIGGKETVVRIGIRELTIPEGGGDIEDLSTTSLTIQAVEGVEYNLYDSNGNLVSPQWQVGSNEGYDSLTVTFTGLNPGETYYVAKRTISTGEGKLPSVIEIDEDGYTTATEETENDLKEFEELYEELIDKIEDIDSITKEELDELIATYDKLTGTMKELPRVKDKNLQIESTKAMFELKEIFESYDANDYLSKSDANKKDIYQTIVDLYEQAIIDLRNSESLESLEEIFNVVVEDMGNIKTREDFIALGRDELEAEKDRLLPYISDDSESIAALIKTLEDQKLTITGDTLEEINAKVEIGKCELNATAFREYYKEILAKDSQDITEEDETVIEEALNTYFAQPKETQELLEAEYDKLIGRKIAIAKLEILERYEEILANENYNSYSQADKDAIDNAKDLALTLFENTTSYDEVEKAKSKGLLYLYQNEKAAELHHYTTQDPYESKYIAVVAGLNIKDTLDFESVDQIYEKAIQDIQKQRAKSVIEKAYSDIIESENYPSYSEEDKASIENAKIKAIENIGKSTGESAIENAKEDGLIDMARKVAIAEVNNYIDIDDNDNVKNYVEESKGLINTQTDIESIGIVVKDIKLTIDKLRAVDELDKKYQEIITSPAYEEFSQEDKDSIKETAEKAIASIYESVSIDDINQNKVQGIIDMTREEHKGSLNAILTEDDDAIGINIIKTAIAELDQVNTVEEFEEITSNAKLELSKNRAKKVVEEKYLEITLKPNYDNLTQSEKDAIAEAKDNAIEAIEDSQTITSVDENLKLGVTEISKEYAIGDLNDFTSEDTNNDITDITTSAIEELENATTVEQVEEITAKAKLEIEKVRAKDSVEKKYQELISEENYDDFTAQDKSAIEEAKQNAIKNIEEASDKTEIDEAVDKAIIDMIKEIAKAECTVLDNGEDNENVGKLIDIAKSKIENVSTDYDKEFDIIIDELINQIEFERARDKAIQDIKDIINTDDSQISVDIAQDYEALISEIKNPTDDGKVPSKTELENLVTKAKEKIEIERARDKSFEELENIYSELINSGKYNEVSKGSLKDIYTEAVKELEKGADKDAFIAIIDQAVKDLGEIKVSGLTSGLTPENGTVPTPDNQPDYAKDHNFKTDGLIGGVATGGNTNISSNLNLTIREFDVADSVVEKFNSSNNKLTVRNFIKVEMTDESGNIVTVPNGDYKITVLLTPEMRDNTDIKIAYTDSNGNIAFAEVERNGNFITFTAPNVGSFGIMGNKAIDLTWLIILLTVIIVIELLFIAYILLRNRKQSAKGSKTVKASAFATPGILMLAISYLPTGAIGTIIALACVAAILGIGIVYLLLKNKPKQK